ncbi:hypothetical protein R1sor_017529 [Riccia sorocarpa]|uniref:Reverse transcriptase zinc-binding domain-containing protein n=1 Tax=Riccia sorocarpa TaxID=122646 RepID=A0ABD3IB64_9MARC
MDCEALKDPTRRAEAKEAWTSGWMLSEDPVIAWELAWGRLREKFKDFRRRERERRSYLQLQQSRLLELRESMASGVTEEGRALLGSLEEEVKEKELMEASIIRRRSRIQWVSEGDDNTRYFYACLQAKQTQEKLVELQGENGESIIEEEDLLSSVHSFYQDLYRQPNISSETQEERRESFKLTQKFVDGEDNCRLVATPDEEEIQRIVDALPSNKAPGEDGLTMEVLKQGIETNRAQRTEIAAFQNWLSKVHLGVNRLQDSPSWRWGSNDDPWAGWSRPSKFWGRLLSDSEITEDLSEKWQEGRELLTWKQRWKALWETKSSTRSKLWFWRVLHSCFFTGERAERMGVAADPCKRCHEDQETTSHLFWGCRKVKRRWRELNRRATRLAIPTSDNLIDWIDSALTAKTEGTSMIHILPAIFQMIWTERNDSVFNQHDRQSPLDVALAAARIEAEVNLRRTTGTTRHEQGMRCLNEIDRLCRPQSLMPRRSLASTSPSRPTNAGIEMTAGDNSPAPMPSPSDRSRVSRFLDRRRR